MASGAPATQLIGVRTSLIFLSWSLSVMTTNSQGCVLRELPVHRAI